MFIFSQHQVVRRQPGLEHLLEPLRRPLRGISELDTVTLNGTGLAESLVNGTQYAIVLQTSAAVRWDWTATTFQVGSSGTAFPATHDYTTT